MALLRRTAHRPMPVHWINYLSGRDLLAGPGPGALLRLPYTTVTNVVVVDADDLSLRLPPVVQRSVTSRPPAIPSSGAARRPSPPCGAATPRTRGAAERRAGSPVGPGAGPLVGPRVAVAQAGPPGIDPW